MREEEKEKGRGEVSGSRVISPSQHRPLNSTPLVETKSDTRKAKLLQMHKPFSIRPPPPPSTLSRPHRCFSPSPPFPPPPPPPFGVCNLPERPPRFPPPLSTLAPFSYPLILSQPFSLRKCRSAIHLSPSSTFLAFLPFSFYFLCFPYCLFLYFSSFFFMRRTRTFHRLVLFFPLFLYIRKISRSRFLFYYSIPQLSIARRALFSEEQLLDFYLTPLINSRHKSLRFGLFYGTRPSLEVRKIEWSLSLFTFSSRPVRSILMYKASSKRAMSDNK